MTYHTHARIAALVAAGFFTAAGAGVAYADTTATTSGNGSILGGNQLVADLDVPVNACGNAIAVLGVAGAQCTDSGAVVEDDSSSWTPEKPEEPETPDESEKPETPEKPENPEKPEKPGYGGKPDDGGHDGGGHDGGGHDGGHDDGYGGGDHGGGGGGGGHDGGNGGGGGTPEEPVSPPATDEEPPAPAPELARTGTDGSALSGLFASAAAAIAAGAGLLLFGRRRARA
ncbi:chaplin [Nocardiopsis dassonvillei]|uniref:chaplin n=1 Tax=Nocardiopsis dassonvillei TaxID=2014 RepID=UPI0020A350DB|nr:chaplin [Nocardiopsis dassonvillei]MCP3015665.1 chaplin [Nocardiopsis dassonvillei]